MNSIVKSSAGGNDFLLIEVLDIEYYDDFIFKLSDRRFGIGCDQIILYKKNNFDIVDIKIYNNDKSVAKNCGNGIRALMFLLYKKFGITETCFKSDYIFVDGFVENEIPTISFDIPSIDQNGNVCIGNSHKVLFVESFEGIDFTSIPDININYVVVNNKNEVSVRTIERGVGYTMSCGSGNVASCFKAMRDGLTSDDVVVLNEKSRSVISFRKNKMYLSGHIDLIGEFSPLTIHHLR